MPQQITLFEYNENRDVGIPLGGDKLSRPYHKNPAAAGWRALAVAGNGLDTMFQIWYDIIIIMKYKEILVDQLKSLPYFSKESLISLSKQFGLKATTVDAYISRSLVHKDIISLKKGIYVTADFYNQHAGDISYTFYLANILRPPSYVSSWAALQYYELTTEAIGTVTSVTPKITRVYNNLAGSFSYQSIKKDLFSGFNTISGKFNFFIASPAKALFDLLYFKTRQFRGVNIKMIDELVDNLRIDMDEMETNERDALYAMVKKYLM